MGLSLAQLLTPSTETESLASLLTVLDALGFSATSWQSGSTPHSICTVVAKLHSALTLTRVELAKGRFNDLAEGDWLDLLSESVFANRRLEAVATQVMMALSDPDQVGPFTIVARQLVAIDPASNTYRNTAGGTLVIGGSLNLLFEAEVAGAAAFPTSLELATPLAGIVAAQLGEPLVVGTDAEKGPRLKTRNRAKWSTLAYAAPADAYVANALAASASVTRAYVDDQNPRGPSTVDLYIAGSNAEHLLPASVATTVSDFIRGRIDGVYRMPTHADLQVFVASATNVPVTATIYRRAGFTDAAIYDAAIKALDAMFSSLAVGGTVQLASLYHVLMSVPGVSDVFIASPTADVRIPETRTAILQANLTIQSV